MSSEIKAPVPLESVYTPSLIFISTYRLPEPRLFSPKLGGKISSTVYWARPGETLFANSSEKTSPNESSTDSASVRICDGFRVIIDVSALKLVS